MRDASVTSVACIELLVEHVATHAEESANVKKLCQDYQLYSPCLDGNVNALLNKFIELIDKDHDSLQAMLACHQEDHDALTAKVSEYHGQLKQQTEHCNEEYDAMVAKLMDLKKEKAEGGN